VLERPLVMGILNVTPDSFSDGGDYFDPVRALGRGRDIVVQGAQIVDVGGESTRPGAEQVSPTEEISRVRPVVSALALEDACVSIDTRHPEVAAACVEAGARVINDISGFRDHAMIEVAAGCEAGVVVTHMLGEPGTMQKAPTYDDVVTEVRDYLERQAFRLRDAGIARERIVVDPGIGFGKTVPHNLEILRRLGEIAALGYPVLIGASRKRFIGAVLEQDEPRRRGWGSVGAAVAAFDRGASILRVHDVGETVQALAVASAISRGKG
jgi:dihydropteroate synthase